MFQDSHKSQQTKTILNINNSFTGIRGILPNAHALTADIFSICMPESQKYSKTFILARIAKISLKKVEFCQSL